MLTDLVVFTIPERSFILMANFSGKVRSTEVLVAATTRGFVLAPIPRIDASAADAAARVAAAWGGLPPLEGEFRRSFTHSPAFHPGGDTFTRSQERTRSSICIILRTFLSGFPDCLIRERSRVAAGVESSGGERRAVHSHERRGLASARVTRLVALPCPVPFGKV